jgi:hypothetical protein
LSIVSAFLKKLSGGAVPEIDLSKYPLAQLIIEGQFKSLVKNLSDDDLSQAFSMIAIELRRRKRESKTKV